MTKQRTYWHLEHLNRKPTDYEVASSNLLYHPERGFEVRVPLEDWYRKYQKESPFLLSQGERFADPRETTYATYTALQRDKEIYVNGLFQAMEETNYDRALSAGWLAALSRVIAPLRFPAHGLQMAAAYVGQMAPSGRIVIAALFQAADEIRRIQRLAYRLRLLQETHPEQGRDGRKEWETDPVWQPLRRAVEELLVTYDWGEALVALNLVLKPVFDEFFMIHFGELADRSGDPLLGKILLSLNEDCRWHREWTAALVRTALLEKPENQGVIAAWIRRWHPKALGAVAPFEPLLAGPSGFAALVGGVERVCREYWASANLSNPLG